jgi:hypothetical protein
MTRKDKRLITAAFENCRGALSNFFIFIPKNHPSHVRLLSQNQKVVVLGFFRKKDALSVP